MFSYRAGMCYTHGMPDKELLLRKKGILAWQRIGLVLLLVFCVYASAAAPETVPFTVCDTDGTITVEVPSGTVIGTALAVCGKTLTSRDTASLPLTDRIYAPTSVTINRNAQDSPGAQDTAALSAKIYDINLSYYQSILAEEEEQRRREEMLEQMRNSGPAEVTAVINPDGTITTRQGTYEIVDVITMEASAYCPCEICCGIYASGYTADGSKATAMHTVATSDDYDFGTLMYIPYFDNVFEVEDRGGAIQDNRIDIYYDTHEEALIFGRHTIIVYIIR